MKQGIAYFIAITALANILAGLWLMWWANKDSDKIPAKDTTHVWDGDLTEYNNPLPRWWLWLFILSIVFALGYLVLFPGLGNYPGLLHWSSASQLSAENATARETFERRFAAYKDKSLTEISADPSAMSTAKNLFALNCSSCHGSDARGTKGFPNLTDQDWLWGGSEQAMYQTIAMGRDNAMPAWGPVLGADGVEQVMAYVLSLSGRQVHGSAGGPGNHRKRQDALRDACARRVMGRTARVIKPSGAPNLTDNIWLHGGSRRRISGKRSRMAASITCRRTSSAW